jgi:hypothetical protein
MSYFKFNLDFLTLTSNLAEAKLNIIIDPIMIFSELTATPELFD